MATKVFNKTILQTSFTSLESIYYLLQTVKDNQPMSSADGKDFIFPQARAKIAQARGGEWSEDKRDTHAELTLAEMRFIRYTDENKTIFEVSDIGNTFLSSFRLNMIANDDGKYNLALEDKLCLQDKNQLIFDILTGIKVEQPKYGRKIRPYIILFKLLIDNSLGGYLSKSEWAYFINNSSFVSDNQYEQIRTAALNVRNNNTVVEPQKSDRILTRLVLWKVLDRILLGKDNSNFFTLNTNFLETIKNNFYLTGSMNVNSGNDIFNLQKGILQKIYYGAPGTGKSNEIKALTGVGKNGIKFSKNFTFRTTFHPDSDYSSFVGCYKPTQKERTVDYKEWDKLKEIADNLPTDNGDKVKAIVKFIRENAESINKIIEEKGYEKFSTIFGKSAQENEDTDSETFGWNNNSYLGSFLEEILKERIENSNGQLTYAFTPQAFTKAYVAAWTHPNENVALVIEEINRGNCAQIFGDIFQLLDRESNGLSKYPIEADNDMQAYLNMQFANLNNVFSDEQKTTIDDYYKDHYDTAFADIKSGKILSLPTNLSILCTMNTSDQSLFPMDSAFKRRWDWQYMPIKNGGLDWKIELSENFIKIDWWEFLKRINKVVADLTTSEDKQLGYFFCQPDSFVDSKGKSDDDKHDLITAKHFVDKVIFYLWNDVFKDYAFDASCCKDENGKEVLFAQFYNEDGKSVNTDVLKHFFETLKSDNEPSLVEEITAETQDEPDVE